MAMDTAGHDATKGEDAMGIKDRLIKAEMHEGVAEIAHTVHVVYHAFLYEVSDDEQVAATLTLATMLGVQTHNMGQKP